MIKLRVLVSVFFVVLFSVTTLNQSSLAQSDPTSCDDLLSEMLATAQQACTNLAPGQVCYGAGTVTLEAAQSSEAAFSASGDIIPLEAVASLRTTAADPTQESWGVVLFKLPSGAPDQAITLALFGEAEATNRVEEAVTTLATLEVRNGVGYAVNLREGPGTDTNVIGTFDWNARGVADGRNADGQWLRLQTDSGPAWVNTSLVTFEGDINTLAVLDSPYTQPMQALNLITVSDQAICGAGSAGLLVHVAGETTAHLQVNGVDLASETATLLVQAQPNASLQVHVIEGSVTLKTTGRGVAAEQGESAQVALGGAGGLEPVAEPEVQAAYRFAAVEGLPSGLVAEEPLACIAGVTSGETLPASYRQPSADAAVAFTLEPDAHYPVVGWSAGEQGERWWQVETGQALSWIPQNAVRTLGACGSVAEVTPTVSVPRGGSSSGTSSTTGSGLVPSGQSVWQANTGLDNVSGACNFPPLVMCSHMAAINPNADGSISWRGQEPQSYRLRYVAENTYSFNGRNGLNNANLSMALTFTSESAWTMTMTQVFDDDPQCTHTFYYSATRNW